MLYLKGSTVEQFDAIKLAAKRDLAHIKYKIRRSSSGSTRGSLEILCKKSDVDNYWTPDEARIVLAFILEQGLVDCTGKIPPIYKNHSQFNALYFLS